MLGIDISTCHSVRPPIVHTYSREGNAGIEGWKMVPFGIVRIRIRRSVGGLCRGFGFTVRVGDFCRQCSYKFQSNRIITHSLLKNSLQ